MEWGDCPSRHHSQHHHAPHTSLHPPSLHAACLRPPICPANHPPCMLRACALPSALPVTLPACARPHRRAATPTPLPARGNAAALVPLLDDGSSSSKMAAAKAAVAAAVAAAERAAAASDAGAASSSGRGGSTGSSSSEGLVLPESPNFSGFVFKLQVRVCGRGKGEGGGVLSAPQRPDERASLSELCRALAPAGQGADSLFCPDNPDPPPGACRPTWTPSTETRWPLCAWCPASLKRA